jgi:zinc protease
MCAESMNAGRSKILRDAALLLVLLLPALPAMAMPLIQHWETANGARVYFVAAPELPMVDINVTFAAGSARDDGNAGLSHLVSTLLDSGAAGMSANEIADRVQALGAELNTGAARDMAWVSLRTLSDTEHRQPALAILADVLGKPDFNAADIERERARMQVAIRSEEQSPDDVAENAEFAAMYGTHPYASRPSGTPDSVRKISRKQILAFYHQYYVAHNAIIAIVGDVDRKGAEQIAETVSAKMQPGSAAASLPVPATLTSASEQRIFHPSAQTHILVGAPGMRRGDPDYFPLYVGNYVLGGGGLVSRLSDEIREKRGLSYSVASYFNPMEQNGPFLLSLQTRNNKADEALSVLRTTLKKFMQEGPTDVELVAAKKNLTGGFPLRIDSNSKILDYLVMIGFYGLPLDYLNTFTANVEAVTHDQIVDAFRRRVSPDTMATVIVGGKSQ